LPPPPPPPPPQDVLRTMKQGGRVRTLVPAELGWAALGEDCGSLQPQPPTFATKRQLLVGGCVRVVCGVRCAGCAARGALRAPRCVDW
jgi:hypothetical protein